MGTRTVAAVALVVGGVLAGCGDDPASESLVASADTRAALDVVVEALDWPAARDPLTPTMGDETDLAAWGSPISEEDRKRLSEIALAFDGVPAGAEAVRFQPAFGDEGSLSGAVVVLRHASYSGFLELPGLDLMEADGREIAVPQVVRYTVDELLVVCVWG